MQCTYVKHLVRPTAQTIIYKNDSTVIMLSVACLTNMSTVGKKSNPIPPEGKRLKGNESQRESDLKP